MKGDKEREEICKTRKDAGLNCNGCQYKEKCQGEKVDFVLPEDIKPGTKQAKIYWELKSGKTAAEIIKTKEFASESVYIVARKHFPDAITKNGSARARVKKAAGKVIDKENYFGKPEQLPKEKAPEEKAPEIDKRILNLEKIIKDEEKRRIMMGELRGELKYAKKMLEEGEIVKCYDAIIKGILMLKDEMEGKT